MLNEIIEKKEENSGTRFVISCKLNETSANPGTWIYLSSGNDGWKWSPDMEDAVSFPDAETGIFAWDNVSSGLKETENEINALSIAVRKIVFHRVIDLVFHEEESDPSVSDEMQPLHETTEVTSENSEPTLEETAEISDDISDSSSAACSEEETSPAVLDAEPIIEESDENSKEDSDTPETPDEEIDDESEDEDDWLDSSDSPEDEEYVTNVISFIGNDKTPHHAATPHASAETENSEENSKEILEDADESKSLENAEETNTEKEETASAKAAAPVSAKPAPEPKKNHSNISEEKATPTAANIMPSNLPVPLYAAGRKKDKRRSSVINGRKVLPESAEILTKIPGKFKELFARTNPLIKKRKMI